MIDRSVMRRRPMVLVVDDDTDLREALGETLRDHGFQCALAADGREALQVLSSAPLPDVLLLDLMMPGVDGWQVLAHMRSQARLRRIPVIVISASGPQVTGTLPRTQPLLPKPIREDELIRAVERALAA